MDLKKHNFPKRPDLDEALRSQREKSYRLVKLVIESQRRFQPSY